MRHRVIFLAAALVFPAVVPLAIAQKFLPKTIQFKGAPEYTNDELMQASGLKKGIVLDYADMNAHSQLLMDTGMFATLAFRFDGQDLIFSLTPIPNLYPIRIDNLPIAPGKDLDDKLHARLSLFHGQVPGAGGLQDAVRDILQQMLAAQGIQATVSSSPNESPASHKLNAISYSITAPNVGVSVARLDGASPQFQKQLQDILVQASKAQFSTEESAGNLERAVEFFYEDQGYAAAKVQALRAGDPVVSNGEILVPFAVTVQEGKTYKIGTIQLPTDAPFTADDLKRTLNSSAVSTQGLRLRALWSQIGNAYKSKGYLDCKVIPQPQFDEAAGTVNYRVDVESGPVYHLAFVKFDNVSDQMRTMLMHYWQMLPGDVFDEGYVSSFILKAEEQDPVLRRSLVGVKTTFDATADPQTHDVNVVIHLSR